jgi:hypothetical protein
MKKQIFTSDTWITFMFEGKFYVGRTHLNAANHEMVTGISESGEVLNLFWSRISDVKHLKFIRNTSPTERQPEPALQSHEFNIRWN